MEKTIFTCIYIGKKSLKIFFSRISRQISIKLDTNHPCIKGIKVYTEGQVIFKEEIIAKIGWCHLIFFLMKNKARKVDLYKSYLI
jgi:hypothetical protein